MKNTLSILLVLLMLPFIAIAQRLTASEMLEQTNCTTFDCSNSFIIKKGYSFDSVLDNGQSKMYRYLSDKRFHNGCTIWGTTVLLIKGKNNAHSGLGFNTSVKDEYESLLAEFKAKGFKEIKTTEDDGIVNVQYSSPLYPKCY